MVATPTAHLSRSLRIMLAHTQKMGEAEIKEEKNTDEEVTVMLCYETTGRRARASG